MRQYRLVLVALAITSPSALCAEEAWTVSATWLCRAQIRASCNGEARCERLPAEVLKQVDFEKQTVTDFTSDTPTPILQRRYFSSNFDGAFTTFMVGSSQLFSILDKPSDDPLSKGTYPFQMASLSPSGSAMIYFGDCKPT